MKLENRYGRKFGDNQIIGDLSNKEFFGLTPGQQVILAAWSEGCPVKDKVVARKGPESARERYHNVIVARLLILNSVQELNPGLYTKLTTSVSREADEPVGVYEPANAPETIKNTIVANNTLYGYALPRILVEFMDLDKDQTPDEVKGRYAQISDILKNSIQESRSPLELLARFAESVMVAGVDPDKILKAALSKGYLAENNTRGLYRQFTTELELHSPNLFAYYQCLPPNLKEAKGIAEPEIDY